MRLAILLFVLTGITLASASPAFANQAEDSPLQESREDLAQLKQLLHDRKATAADVMAYVHIVRERHLEAEGPTKDVEAFRRDVEKLLLKALRKTRAKNEVNRYWTVNVAAAEALAEIGPTLEAKVGRSVSAKLKAAIEGLEDERRYTPSRDQIQALFVALASIGTDDALTWMLKEYSNTNAVHVEFLIGAHKAMLLFDDAPGKLRFAVVKEFKKTYSSVENAAEQSANTPENRAKKRFWDQIRTHTIAVLQHFARTPTVDGVALASVHEFVEWFRDHKNVRKAPWIDAE